jgi:hypothetical protein
MPRLKKAESSRSVTEEAISPEVTPEVPERETEAPTKPQTQVGPKRYKSPTTGFIIEDF